MRVWHLPTATCLAACSYGGQQFERAVRQLCWLPAAEAGCSPLLLACGEDGGLQVWQVCLPPDLAASPASAAEAAPAGDGSRPGMAGSSGHGTGSQASCRLVARITAVHRPQDCVTALCAELERRRVWTGDSSGHVAAWDVSALCGAAAAPDGGAAAGEPSPDALPRRLAHWRAADTQVVSLSWMAAGHGLLLVGAQDAAIGIWTRQGGLVGLFGQHSWDLEDRRTWQDPEAVRVPPPLAADGSGTGLTPRDIIAHTPRRTSWLQPQSGRRGSVAARAGGGGSRPATPGSLASSGAAGELAEALASIARVQPAAREGGAAAGPSGGASGGSGGTPEADLAAPPHSSRDAPTAGAAERGQGPWPAAGVEEGHGLQYCLSPRSAGARLAAMAAQAAASKAECWSIPVHVQAHSALPLQRIAAVPRPSTAGAAPWRGDGVHAGMHACLQRRWEAVCHACVRCSQMRGIQALLRPLPSDAAQALGWAKGRGAAARQVVPPAPTRRVATGEAAPPHPSPPS